MIDAVERALAALQEADRDIERASVWWRTLCPVRERAHTLWEIGRGLLRPEDDHLAEGFARGLAALARAQLENFPENLFFDLDRPAHEALVQGRRGGPWLLDEVFDQMADLQRLYGVHTPIRFQYVHDFIYGYDWVKWVGRTDGQDGSVGPYDREFLAYMQRRAHELVELIEANDSKYPQLQDEAPRNPFPFARDPETEIELHRELARMGQIPVPAWTIRGELDPHRDWADIRVETARRMGLLVEP